MFPFAMFHVLGISIVLPSPFLLVFLSFREAVRFSVGDPVGLDRTVEGRFSHDTFHPAGHPQSRTPDFRKIPRIAHNL